MEVIIALSWGLAGWLMRVVWTYYIHSKEVESGTGRFRWKSFVKKYDQDWIMGFVAMLVFSLISDWAWVAFLSDLILSRETIYDPKVNVLIGFMAIFIVEKLAHKKS